MKKLLVLLFIIGISFQIYSKDLDKDLYSKFNICIQNNFGYTLVNVSKAVDVEKAESSSFGLVDWNQFHYTGLIQFFIRNSQMFSWGAEIGFNRLYYWEEKYLNVSSYPRWRWNTIWTWDISGLIKLHFGKNYILTGLGFHTFMDESGTTVSIPIAAGHNFQLSKNIAIPIEARVNVIFGSAIPVGLSAGVGIIIGWGN